MWMVLSLALALQDDPPVPPQPVKPREVVVIGTRRESDVRDVPSAVTVVTREQIEQSGASTIVEALERTPSFFAQGPNKGGVDALADWRGYNNGAGNGQRTLVLVDGRRTNGVTTGATDWASIPLDNVERIEIVRGPAAALYGDPALAGAINIITKKGDRAPAAARARGEGGSWSTWRAAGTVSGASNGSSYSVWGGSERTEGWRDNGGFDASNFTGAAEIALGHGLLLHLKVGGHDDERRRPGTLTKEQIETMGRNATVTPDDFADRTEGYGDTTLSWVSTLGDFSVQLHGLQGESDSHFDFGTGTFDSDDEFEQSAVYIKHVVTMTLFGRPWTFTAGVDAVYETAESFSESVFFGSPSTVDADYERRLLGSYAHVEARPLERLVVSGSIRWDRALFDLDRDVTGFGFEFDRARAFDQWSPALGATYHVLELVSVYAGYGRPFKYPTRDELNGFTAADPQLVPERSHSYDAGVRVASERWGEVSAGWYLMDVKDEIYFDPMLFVNLNFDEVRHQGLEGAFQFTPLESGSEVRLAFFGTYTYTRAVVESGSLEGKKYPVTPAHMATAGGTVMWGGAYVTAASRFVGRRHLVSDTLNENDLLPKYAVFDVKGGWTFGKGTLTLGVYNVLDREYFDGGGLTFAGPAFNPAPERSFLAGFEMGF